MIVAELRLSPQVRVSALLSVMQANKFPYLATPGLMALLYRAESCVFIRFAAADTSMDLAR